MRPTIPSLTLALALTSALAHGQTVLFEDDFSDPGLSSWTVNGSGTRFHLYDPESACGEEAAPPPSGDFVVRAGSVGGCAFDTLTTMTLATPVHLPAGETDIRLTFWSYDNVECGSCGWDWRFVYLSDNGGGTWSFLGESDALYQWYQKSFDLTPWAGSDVLVRFTFDPVDNIANGGLGWLIDDVEIVTDACAPPASYCISAPNSAGPGAVMGWSGSTSIAADDFSLSFSGAPPSQFAIFFYGPDTGLTQLSDGYLCIGRGAVGFVRMGTVVQADATGAGSLAVDYSAASYGPGWITPGSTWHFQAWYRDPGAGNTGSNFTDALTVRFCE